MSKNYRHFPVSHLNFPTVEGNEVTFMSSDDSPKKADKSTYPYWLGDIPVSGATYELAKKIKRAMPWVEFGIVMDWSYTRSYYDAENNCGIVFSEVFVYVPNHQYVLGRIGYRDYGVRECVNAYGVMSRKIKIGKVRHHERACTAISADVDRALKHAVKNLTPYTTVECAKLSYEDFHSKVAGEVTELGAAADKFIYACRSASVLTAEITNLIRQNVEFVTPEFKAAAAHYLSAQQELVSAKAKKIGGYYVNLFTDKDKQFARVAAMRGDVKAVFIPTFETPNDMIIPVEEIPMDVQSKLAVLMSLSNESHAPGIGYRVNESAFWVEREIV